MDDLNQKAEQLEALVDSLGLARVVGMLGCICWEKADHISANWQDDSTARVWIRAAGKLGALETHFEQILPV